jgi:dTDP-4-dehydrorhamnose reductase
MWIATKLQGNCAKSERGHYIVILQTGWRVGKQRWWDKIVQAMYKLVKLPWLYRAAIDIR